MLRIGITGGIGCGKTMVSRIFSTLGIPVFDTDCCAKQISAQEQIQQQIIRLFPSVSDGTGKVDTQKLGAWVFSHPSALGQLNHLIHPLVFQKIREWYAELLPLAPPYVLVESAILHEVDMGNLIDYSITVEARPELQIARCQIRNPRLSTQEIRSRIQRQWSSEQRKAHSDFVITNDDTRSVLLQVLETDRILRNKSSKWPA